MRNKKEDVFVLVDGINVNATYFGSMELNDAVEAMINNGFTKDETWAMKAYEAAREKLGEQ